VPISGRVRQLVGDSLVRNSGFLAANIGLGAVSGFGALSLLGRLYSVQAVGLSAAALSATSLITAISSLGMNYSLVRFLPMSTHRTALINSVLTAAVLVALAGGSVFLVLPAAARLYALGGAAFAVVFLLSSGVAAVQGQLQNVFVADRSAKEIARANVFISLVKLAAPAALVFLGVFGAYVAQCLPVAVAAIILAMVLARRGHQFRPALSATATRDLRRFSAGTYIASLIGTAPSMLLPLVILSRFGPNQNAYWYAAISGATLLFQLPGSVGTALLAEASHRPAERRALMRRSAVLISCIMLPVLSGAYLAAPLGLVLLGHDYTTNSIAPLRWLIVAGAMSSVNYLTGTVLYLAKKSLVIAIINTIDAVIVIGLAATWAHNARDVALCWVVGEVANVVLFAFFAGRALRQVHGRWDALGSDEALSRRRRPCPGAQT
jgi:O-antigen/teichoic acid export membrane protein